MDMDLEQVETNRIWRELGFALLPGNGTPVRDLVTKASQKLGLTEEQVYSGLKERGWGDVLDQRLYCDALIDAEPAKPGQGFKRKPTT